MKTLVIVESPAKAKKIAKFLGDGYIVKASCGHIRAIAKKNKYICNVNGNEKNVTGYGIDMTNGFEPKYENMTGKGKVIRELRETWSKCDDVILATDGDREGHAIAWHVAQILKLNIKKTKRIIFYEITKSAIKNAIKSPMNIDINQVYSQQARAVLDKIVGFELSPLLWKNIKSGLSAGRVQSVTVKLIVEKENNINDFESESFYVISGLFYSVDNKKNIVNAILSKNIEKRDDVIGMLKKCRKSKFKITNITIKEVKKNPPPPFITSTLQQSVGKSMGIGAKMVMSIAQKLYESGKITYHRTDSVSLSSEITGKISEYVDDKYGSQYAKTRRYGNKSKNAQEAHEAIRPTKIDVVELNDKFSSFEKKVYSMIWKRTVASQMASEIIDVMKIDIAISKMSKKSDPYFKCELKKTKFDGYTILYNKEHIDEISKCKLKINDYLKYSDITATQTYTKQASRYSEPTLVKDLEKRGIGRPSTYANIINTILQRGYVIKKDVMLPDLKYEIIKMNEYDCKNDDDGDDSDDGDDDSDDIDDGDSRSHNSDDSDDSGSDDVADGMFKITIETKEGQKEKNKMTPTKLGIDVTNFLIKHFGENILDYEFTSQMENKLDNIANGDIKWNKVVGDYYNNFYKTVEDLKKLGNTNKVKGKYKNHIGKDNDGNDIYATNAKYGPVLQIGDGKKCRFIGLPKKTDIESITYDDIKELLQYPKIIGKHDGKDVTLNKGKYGKYFKWNGSNYSAKKCKVCDMDAFLSIIDKK